MSSDEAAPAEKPGLFARIRSLPATWTTAGCVSVILAFFLVLTVITVWTVFLLDPNHVPWRHSMSWVRMAAVVALTIVTPYVCYRTLRLWMEGDQSRFPEIDYAWKAGMEALRKNGISMKSTPVFIVLGSPGERLEKALVDASGLSFRVRGVPDGPGPLHWYANAEGIYVVCSSASWLSCLNVLIEGRAHHVSSTDVPSELDGDMVS